MGVKRVSLCHFQFLHFANSLLDIITTRLNKLSLKKDRETERKRWEQKVRRVQQRVAFVWEHFFAWVWSWWKESIIEPESQAHFSLLGWGNIWKAGVKASCGGSFYSMWIYSLYRSWRQTTLLYKGTRDNMFRQGQTLIKSD